MNRDNFIHRSNESLSNVFYLFKYAKVGASKNINTDKTDALKSFKLSKENYDEEGEFGDMDVNKRYEAACVKVCEELEYRFSRGLLDNGKLIAIVNRYDLNDSQRQLLMNIYINRLTAISFYRTYKSLRRRVISERLNVRQLENLIKQLKIEDIHKNKMFYRLKAQIETKFVNIKKIQRHEETLEIKL